jgi:hypothetical protein
VKAYRVMLAWLVAELNDSISRPFFHALLI